MTEAEYQAMLADREEGKDCNFEHLARYAAAGCNRERIERIPALEAEVIRLRKNATEDAWLMSAYHEWCRQNDCMPSSSDLLKARGVIQGGG